MKGTRKIRIGKSFGVQWSVYRRNGDAREPYQIDSANAELYVVTPFNEIKATSVNYNGNVVSWLFSGGDQKYIGDYTLKLIENAGKESMITVDTCKAFELVAHSCEEWPAVEGDLEFSDVVLESEVALAPVVDPTIKKDIENLKAKDKKTDLQLAELSEETEVLKEAQQFTDVAIKDLQDMKIDREADDYYPQLSVGLADNLAGVDVVDSEINFRRSGGGAISDGVARIESIKGNSVVWNQLVSENYFSEGTKEGVTFTIEGTAVVLNGTAEKDFDFQVVAAQRIGIINTHKYVILGGEQNKATYNFYDSALIGGSGRSNSIFAAIGTGLPTQRIYCYSGQTFTNYKIYPRLIDLTQMFGPGYEPTTIEEFYARIPMGVDMNAYNEGEVIHMDVQSLESQGVNAWDEEWEVGTIYTSTGANNNYVQDSIRSKNYIPIVGGATYYATSRIVMWGFFYDKDKQPISKNVTATVAGLGSSIGSQSWVAPSNACYLRFYLLSSYGTTYNHDICINLSDASINGKYFPYIKRVEDLSIIRKYFPDGMKSADAAHDEIRYNKATQKWEKVVRIGEMDMGSLAWGKSSSGTYTVYSQSLAALIKKSTLNLFTKNLIYGAVDGENTGFIKSDRNGTIYASLAPYTDAASFKAAMQGVILYYELAEPIVTELDETEQFKDLDYQVWNGGTEKAIAEGKSAPLAADITYGFNAIGKIKELESLVAQLRAKVGI